MQKYFHILVLTGAVTLAASFNIQAQLIAYDGFNYTPGTGIAGATGGDSFGWGTAWYNAGTTTIATNVAGSLNYTDPNGNVLQTDGGSLIVGYNIPGGSSSTATPQRTLSSADGLPLGTNMLSGGTYWISFLMNWVGPSNSTSPQYVAQGSLGLYSSSTLVGGANSGTERADIGGTPTSPWTDHWTAWNANSRAVATGGGGFTPTHNSSATAYNDATTGGAASATLNSASGSTFVLIEIVTQALGQNGSGAVTNATGFYGADSMYVWYNWTNLTIMPTIATANIVDTNEALLANVNEIRIAANGDNATRTNSLLQVDEIRIGLGALDVMPVSAPEPATIALAALGGLALLGLRRNRR